jgi:hypothetical protein
MTPPPVVSFFYIATVCNNVDIYAKFATIIAAGQPILEEQA